MNIVITGGSGFIGSNFIDYWRRNHYEDLITNIDKMTYASNRWFNRNVENSVNYRFIEADINLEESMENALEGVDCIVNFAAESHVDRSISNPKDFINSNIVGVYNILEYVRKHDIQFHQVSTDEVYGSLDLFSSEKFSEQSCYNPRNPYSATKASADFLVRSYVNTYGIKATVSNCGNNFGPHQHPEKLIPKTILHALSGQSIPVYGNGNQIRDWVFVEDHCSAIDVILRKGKIGETYLVGSNNERKNIDIIRLILDKLDLNRAHVENVKDRPGHDVRYSLSPHKIQSELGWKPNYSFDDALNITVNHYKKYKGVYDKMITP